MCFQIRTSRKYLHVTGDVGGAAAPASGRDVIGRTLGMGPGVCRHGAWAGAARCRLRQTAAAQVHAQPTWLVI